MTNNRVYVTIDEAGNPKYISYYDKENKRKKQIDLDKPHMAYHHIYITDTIIEKTIQPKAFLSLIQKKRRWLRELQKFGRRKVMLVGKNGKPLVKVNWDEFKKWQGWDEYPEFIDNPPMTVDMTFYYNDNEFYLDAVRDGYAIFSSEWKEILFDKNFLKLLTKPLFEGNSFKDLIEQFLFVN